MSLNIVCMASFEWEQTIWEWEACVSVAQWQMQFESTFSTKKSSSSDNKSVLDGLKTKMRVCNSGLSYARSISNLIKIVLPLYMDSGHQMSTKVGSLSYISMDSKFEVQDYTTI